MQSFGYELLYILPGIASQDELASVVAQVSETLKKEGANTLRHELWCERRLAYPIKQHDTGKYILCYFTASADAVPRIQQALRLSTAIVRHRIIRHENIEIAMNAFFAYEEMIKEKRRALALRPKERRFEQSRFTGTSARGAYQPMLGSVSEPHKPSAEAAAETRESMPPAPLGGDEEQKTDTGAPIEQTTAETPKKKPSLAELDQKLDKLLEGDIEL